MAMIKKSITVTDKHNAFIQSQIASGDFTSDSEVIRDALRLKQAQLEEIQVLREALESARASGFTDMSADQILTEIKDELRNEKKSEQKL